jgi:hypothetical protein
MALTFIQQCSPAQLATAKESFDFWTGKLPPVAYTITLPNGAFFVPPVPPLLVEAQAYGFLGNEQCEDSFNGKLRGDKDTAGGEEQWHADRQQALLRLTGIDVWNDPHPKQLIAAYYELLEIEKAAFAKITAAKTPADAAAAVCEYLERAGEPGAIAARSAAADDWAAYAAANWGATS